MWVPNTALLFALGLILASVSAQPGFLSLDCGALNAFSDGNGIEWTPEDNYISTGTKASISSALKKSSAQVFQQLRYFPDTSRKHCYALPVLVGETYPLRPRFYYGNYNGLDLSQTQFDVLIGANKVLDASPSPSTAARM